MPHQFYGTVTLDGAAAPDGTAVEARIGDTVAAVGLTTGGTYGYAPALFLVADTDTSLAGKTLAFFVNGLDTGVTADFTNGGYTKLDLAAVTAPVEQPAQTSGGSAGAPPASQGGGVILLPSSATNTSMLRAPSGISGTGPVGVADTGTTDTAPPSRPTAATPEPASVSEPASTPAPSPEASPRPAPVPTPAPAKKPEPTPGSAHNRARVPAPIPKAPLAPGPGPKPAPAPIRAPAITPPAPGTPARQAPIADVPAAVTSGQNLFAIIGGVFSFGTYNGILGVISGMFVIGGLGYGSYANYRRWWKR